VHLEAGVGEEARPGLQVEQAAQVAVGFDFELACAARTADQVDEGVFVGAVLRVGVVTVLDKCDHHAALCMGRDARVVLAEALAGDPGVGTENAARLEMGVSGLKSTAQVGLAEHILY